MSKNESKLLEETKQIVKSLVIPHPRGVGLRQLCDEYQEIEGKQLPYKELGFHTLSTFLRSIPDVVRMYGNHQDLGSVVLFPVADESTAHIMKMVAEQNKTKRGAKRKTTRHTFYTNPHNRISSAAQSSFNTYHNHYANHKPLPLISSRPPVFNSSNASVLTHSLNAVKANYQLNKTSSTKMGSNSLGLKSKQSNVWHNFSVTRDMSTVPKPAKASAEKSRATSNPNLNVITRPTAKPISGDEFQRNSQSPFMSSHVKENLKQLMTSRDMEDGVMLFNFDARYKHQFKEALDWKKYGFSSLVDCLKSVPHIVTMIPTGTSTYKIMPPTADNDNQQTSQYPTTTTVLRNGHSMAIITTTSTSTTVTFVTSSCNTITTTSITTQNNVTLNSITPITSPISLGEVSNPSTQSSRESSPTSHINISLKAIHNFRHVLSLYPNGIDANEFAQEYENAFKVKFDSNIWGYSTAAELFHSIPSIFAIEERRTKSGVQQMLHDSRHKKFDKPQPVERIDPTKLCYLASIPDIIQARILKLTEANMPSGLPLPYFMEEYKINYGDIELQTLEVRCSDTSHLFSVLKCGLPIEVKMVDGIDRAFLKSKKEVEDWICQCTRQQRYIIPKTMIDVPPNVALPGDVYTDLVFPPDAEVGNNEYVAVYITSAVSPTDMYIQFKGPEYHSALDQLMKLLDFYDYADEDQWGVPKQFLCLGLPVVTRFPCDRFWHRARIIRLHEAQGEDRLVTISFVDYGGILVTDYKYLRLLKKEFLHLPMQGVKVGLYGIKPVLGEKGWTSAARDKVLRFSKENYCLACTFIDKRNELYLVCLCDTNSATDVFIHDVLVTDGHAFFEEDVLEMKSDESNAQNHCETVNSLGFEEIANRAEQLLNDNQMNALVKRSFETNPTVNRSQMKICEEAHKQLANVYHLKWINWRGHKTPILTQNSNGSCPLIAIFNVLMLNNHLHFQSLSQTVTGEELISCLTEHILLDIQNSGKKRRDLINDIFDRYILFRFLTGIDVNVKFGGIAEFEPTLEVKVFELLHISLYHGWIVDPQNASLYSYFRDLSYNELIDHIITNKSSDDADLVGMALAAQQFLECYSTQITYYGIRQLQTDLNNEEICVLFRNNHFVTLYKHENQLYQLLTDQGFLNEGKAVWETLTNIDGNELIVDENFVSQKIGSSQQQTDYEFALSLDKEINQNNGWNANHGWGSNTVNTSVNWNNNNGTNFWNNNRKQSSGKDNIKKTKSRKRLFKNSEKQNSKNKNESHNSPKQDSNDEWNYCSTVKNQRIDNNSVEHFGGQHLINESDSDKENEFNATHVKPFIVINRNLNEVKPTQILDSTIDTIDNMTQLPEPLTPTRSSSITQEKGDTISQKEESNKVETQLESLSQSIPQIEERIERQETPSNDSTHITNGLETMPLSVDKVREVAKKVMSEESKKMSRPTKLTPKITICSDLNTGERHITNSYTTSARNISILNKLELTPNNSGSDTESVGDANESKVVATYYSKDDILMARKKLIKVKNKLVHLIYYKEEFYYTYEGVRDMFEGNELWQLISFSGGYIKGRIQLNSEEGKALFKHLDIKYPFEKRLIFLYPQDSVVDFTSLSGETDVRISVIKSVKNFVDDIARAEKAKYEGFVSFLQKKVKNINFND